MLKPWERVFLNLLRHQNCRVLPGLFFTDFSNILIDTLCSNWEACIVNRIMPDMKRNILGTIVLLCVISAYQCTPNSNPPINSIPNNLLGRWTLTQKQAPGIGGPGLWSAATPAGQWLELQTGGQISGTAFADAISYQVVDSVTLKLIAPTQPAGYYLFNYKIDTLARTLSFYIKPPNGVLCTEGCGGYKLEK